MITDPSRSALVALRYLCILTVALAPFTIQGQQPATRAQAPDSVAATAIARMPDDSLREGALLDAAWQQYRAKSFVGAARAFERVASVAPGALARFETRLLAAQSQLEAERPADAATLFRFAGDSARWLLGQLEAREKDGGLDSLAGLLAERGAVPLLWAPFVRDGKLVAPDTGQRLSAVRAQDITGRLDAIGGWALDPPLRALVWRSEEHTSELQSRQYLVCRLL